MTDLERSLRSLADRDDLFPATPDIAGDLAAQIGLPAPSRRRDWRLVAVVALVVLAALAAALAIPRSRSAIADFFGIEGIRIERDAGERPNSPATPVSIGGSLLLGERATLDQARPRRLRRHAAGSCRAVHPRGLAQPASGATVVG